MSLKLAWAKHWDHIYKTKTKINNKNTRLRRLPSGKGSCYPSMRTWVQISRIHLKPDGQCQADGRQTQNLRGSQNSYNDDPKPTVARAQSYSRRYQTHKESKHCAVMASGFQGLRNSGISRNHSCYHSHVEARTSWQQHQPHALIKAYYTLQKQSRGLQPAEWPFKKTSTTARVS